MYSVRYHKPIRTIIWRRSAIFHNNPCASDELPAVVEADCGDILASNRVSISNGGKRHFRSVRHLEQPLIPMVVERTGDDAIPLATLELDNARLWRFTVAVEMSTRQDEFVADVHAAADRRTNHHTDHAGRILCRTVESEKRR